MKAKRRRGREQGVELVEMAFVLPLLLVLLLGIIAFGRAYDVYQTITRAAREGARQAVLTVCATCPTGACGATATTVGSSACIESNYVNPALQAANLGPTQVQDYLEQYVWLDPPNNTICGVQISFKYPYTLTLPFTDLNLSTLHIPTAVRMRLENQPLPSSACPVGTSP